jgi:hypothetical protein
VLIGSVGSEQWYSQYFHDSRCGRYKLDHVYDNGLYDCEQFIPTCLQVFQYGELPSS